MTRTERLEPLATELRAELARYEAVVSGAASDCGTAVFLASLAELARIVDNVMGREPVDDPEVSALVWRALSALGLATVTADVVAAASAGSSTPTADAVRRVFDPELAERVLENALRRPGAIA